ncbi:MAG: bifunctional adenosylcobinamide kinase/adenosylcobinamide-phosphate guanylyltransferase [Pseudomonadota bacterium]
MGELVFVLGGARSGKSRFAEELASKSQRGVIYIATAQAFDAEMADRIDRHRAQRPVDWRTVDAPLELPAALASARRSGAFVLVDCLTLWLSNTMLAERDVEAACAELISALSEGDGEGDIACVSNEVGLSIVPDNPLGRRFRDAQGRLNQQVAAVADRVVFVAAGLPLQLKPAPAP